VDLAAESRVKLARNNKVPRLGVHSMLRVLPLPSSTPLHRGQTLYFSRTALLWRPTSILYSH